MRRCGLFGLFGLVLLGVLGAACGAEQPPPGVVSTFLSGKLYVALRDRPRTVEVWDYQGGKRGDLLCSTMSDAEGAWTCDVGALFGEFLIEVDAGDQLKLSAIMDRVEQGKPKPSIQTTPVTHLTRIFIEWSMAHEGKSLADALVEARFLFHEHFGRIDQRFMPPSDLSAGPLRLLDDRAMTGGLLHGLDELAAVLAEAQGATPDVVFTMQKLVLALVADLEADGIFDGKGPGGREVKLGDVPLDGDTLRATYGRALFRFLESSRNKSGFTRRDFEPLVYRMAASSLRIFPTGTPRPIDQEGPEIVALDVSTARERIDRPVGGTFYVSMSARDPSGTDALTLEIDGFLPSAIQSMSSGQGWQIWSVDGASAVDGPKELRARAQDVHGNATTKTLTVTVDNTPPVLNARAAGVLQSGQGVRVAGEVRDAIGPVERIEILGAGTSTVIASPAASWSVALDIACANGVALHVKAFDVAQNVAETEVPIRCDASPPSLVFERSVFSSESHLEATYSADGAMVSYAFQGEEPIAFDETTNWPVALTKYFNRLDASSPNLPRLALQAIDQEGSVEVDYRYLLAGVEKRGWTKLSTVAVDVDGGRHYVLDLSYQSLGRELADTDSTKIHRVEIRATDEAGNVALRAAELRMHLRSPPLWFGGCDVQVPLTQYSLQGATLHQLYQSNQSVEFFRSALRYVLDLPPSSLAPEGGIYVQVTPGEAVSVIQELQGDTHRGPTVAGARCRDVISSGLRAIDSNEYMVRRPDGSDGGCLSGVVPARYYLRSAGEATLNELLPHVLGRQLKDQAGQVVVETGLGFPIQNTDVAYSLSLLLSRPRLYLPGGGMYEWPTGLDLPPGYTPGNTTVRYRIATFDQTGVSGSGGGAQFEFATRGFISEFSLGLSPTTLVAEHETLRIPVAIQATEACLQRQVYDTRN